MAGSVQRKKKQRSGAEPSRLLKKASLLRVRDKRKGKTQHIFPSPLCVSLQAAFFSSLLLERDPRLQPHLTTTLEDVGGRVERVLPHRPGVAGDQCVQVI